MERTTKAHLEAAFKAITLNIRYKRLTQIAQVVLR